MRIPLNVLSHSELLEVKLFFILLQMQYKVYESVHRAVSLSAYFREL